MTRLVFVLCLLSVSVPAAEVRGIIPSDGQTPTGPYTPGVMAGDYLYVASQGPRRADGSIPETIAKQVDQSVANVKAIVRAAGLTLDHIVYTHVYLDDMSLYDEMNRTYAKHFATNPPARAVVGVYERDNRMHITINAVAVRDLSMKKAVAIPGVSINEPYAPGILTHDRLFVSGMLGRDLKTGEIPEGTDKQVALALDNVGAVLKAAGLDHRHMIFVNPYVGPNVAPGVMNKVYASYFEFGHAPARATIYVTSLPHEARWCGRRRGIPVPPPALVSPSRIRSTVQRRVASFRESMAASSRKPFRTNCGKPCGTSSTTWKRRAWTSATSSQRTSTSTIDATMTR